MSDQDRTSDFSSEGQASVVLGQDLPYARQSRATEEQYPALQRAYDHFNHTLFNDTLPDCLITMQRRRHTFGYYMSGSFINANGEVTDEIAMNPAFFASRTIEEILATLAHEQTHLWQYHFGTSPRSGYHNRQWANKMIEIGLVPSHTGVEGGSQTGDRMTHYIADGGLFMRSAQELTTSGFRLEWYDRFPETVIEPPLVPPPEPTNKRTAKKDPPPPRHIPTTPLPTASLLSSGIELTSRVQQQHGKRSSKVTYTCTHCDMHVWGRAGLAIMCRNCNMDLVAKSQDAEAEGGDPA